MQNREEERPSEFEAEILQLPSGTVTANKPVIGLNAGTKAEAIGQVENEKEESEISLQLPANKQASYRCSASSEKKRLTQNICLLEFVSEKLEHASAAETSIDTPVEQTVTVEAKKVGIEKSKEIVSDPPKENPEKLQNESFLLGEHVETKERKEIDAVVTERNVGLKKDNDFANECQLCQFNTETVTMIEQLMDQRPRNAQLGKHNPDSERTKSPSDKYEIIGNQIAWNLRKLLPEMCRCGYDFSSQHSLENVPDHVLFYIISLIFFEVHFNGFSDVFLAAFIQ
ncbi:UNVERIFIED_CONTAM: hypothetical protein K2H54_042188 [Gekko kuhli]